MSAEAIGQFFSGIPTWWATFFMAMLPVTELRGSIPWAITLGNLPWYEAYIASVLGNFVPAFPLLLFMEQLLKIAEKFPFSKKIADYFLRRTRKRAGAVEKYGFLGLAIFVGIPLPVTGAWTGALAAFIFGIPIRKALVGIALGILLSATIVTSITMGLFKMLF
ncbi:MAG: small multi-drug export protein [candidate division Zixibacteria bacterium]|nr:small multi-drug export protein [candidate division Zixibacteria bacterium]